MKILCFGALNIDYTYSVQEMVKAGETIASSSLTKGCGGKGLNQSIALARAGMNVFHGGGIGADGLFLKELLIESNVNTKYLFEKSSPTGHAIIQLDAKGQNSIIICGGANYCITNSDIDLMLSEFGEQDILLLQNEAVGRDYAIMVAKSKNMQIALNPSPIDSELLKSKELHNIDWFILNETEGCAFTGYDDPNKICDKMHVLFPDAHVVLTLGKSGVMYSGFGKRIQRNAYPLDPIDTTAAGDTFTGYFLSSVTKGEPVEISLEYANKAAALAVSRVGAASSIPTSKEVDALK